MRLRSMRSWGASHTPKAYDFFITPHYKLHQATDVNMVAFCRCQKSRVTLSSISSADGLKHGGSHAHREADKRPPQRAVGDTGFRWGKAGPLGVLRPRPGSLKPLRFAMTIQERLFKADQLDVKIQRLR